jgi:hypothetical protein
MLCLLADLFETSVDDLLGREGKKEKWNLHYFCRF